MDPLSIPFGGAVMDPLSIPFGGAVMDSRAVPSSEKLCCTLMLISLAALTRKLLAAPGRAGLPSSTFPPSVRLSVRPSPAAAAGPGAARPLQKSSVFCPFRGRVHSFQRGLLCSQPPIAVLFSLLASLSGFSGLAGRFCVASFGGGILGQGVWCLVSEPRIDFGQRQGGAGGGGVDFCTRGRTVGASPPILPLPHSSCSRQGSARTTPSCPEGRSPPRAPLPSTQPPPPCLIVGFCPPNPSCAVLIWGGRPAEGVARVSAPLLPQGRICLQLLLLTLPHLPPPISGWERRRCGEGEQRVGAHGSPPPPLIVGAGPHPGPPPSLRRGRPPRPTRQGRVTSQHSNVSLHQ